MVSERISERIGEEGVFVAREAELSILRQSLQQARTGRAQVVVIESGPGMGKSALLAAFLGSARDTCEPLWVRCDEFERSTAFAALGLLLGDKELPVGSEVAAARLMLARLGDAQAREDKVSVLAIDDAQWMDRPSARALRFALRRLRFDKVLAVIIRRPSPPGVGRRLTEDPEATVDLRLGPLDADATAELARRLRSWDLSADVAKRLVHRTGGVPLLMSALIRGAATESALDSDVGESLTQAADRMVGSVDRPAQRLVEAAAVLAEPAGLIVLGDMAGIRDPTAALVAATSAGLFTVDPTGAVQFAHDLLREAVFTSLPLSRKRELHVRAARWTTGDRSLAHRAAATVQPDPELAGELETAADAAHAASRYDLAASHRLRARAVSGEADRRERLLLDALIDRVAAQDLDGATELATEAREGRLSARRSLALGLLARECGHVAEARSLLSEALDLAMAADDDVLRERSAIALAVLDVRIDEGAAAVDVLRHADHSSDPERATDVLTTRAIGLSQRDDLPAALALLRVVPTGSPGAPWDADLLAVRGMLRLFNGELRQALADLDGAVDLAHLWRPSTNASRTYALRSVIRFYLGDWDGAAVDAAAALTLADAEAQAWSVPVARAVSSAVPANRGQWQVAVEHLELAKEAATVLRSAQIAETVARCETGLALARRNYEEVLEICEPLHSPEHLERHSSARSYRWVIQATIVACVELNRLDEAERDLCRYQSMLARWPTGPIPSRLGWLQGRLAEARGDFRTAQRAYLEDMCDPAISTVPFLHAEVLYTAGRLDRALGNRREAVDRLAQARDIFASLRARPFLDRCSAELTACGLPSTVGGPLALTAREEDVASLVMRGLSNNEIAAELFLTRRTVEYHLRNIYAKLGISTRQELRRLRASS